MNCLAELLQLNLCGGSITNSFAINSLSGVDVDYLHQLQKSDEPTVQHLIDGIHAQAWLLFTSEFKSILYSRYNMVRAGCQSDSLSKPVALCPVSAGKQGIVINNCSKKLSTIVKRLFFYSNISGNVTFEFWDADMSVLIHSQVVSVINGKNTISVQKAFNSDNLFICYDGSASIAFKTEGCGCCGFSIKGGKTNVTPNIDTMQLSGEHYGLGVDVSFMCMIEDIICANSDMLMNAYVYAFGAALKEEQASSKKSNKATLFKPEEAQQAYNNYMDKLREELESVVMTIDMSGCATCKEFQQTKFFV